MLLSQIAVLPDQYQFRERPFSEQTVKAIVSEGIDLAKFDPIPILRMHSPDAKPFGEEGPRVPGLDVYVVAGDGHSRFEAIRRLALDARLPAEWSVDPENGEWDIPCRLVTESQARKLSWTANLSRDNFSPCEEAAVFQDMLDAGKSIEDIARIAHRSAPHIQRALSLNFLCRDILAAVGASAAAGGIDVLTAQVLANGFKRFNVAPAQQQQLWHCCLKHAMLNFQSAKKFIDRIGAKLGQRHDAGDEVLFSIPANAVAVVAEAKARGSACRSARMGLSLLMKAMEAGGLESIPELSDWLQKNGDHCIAQLSERVTEDGEILASMVAAPKMWKPRPKTVADDRIARQYDPTATPSMF